jgi:hypothetical protein
LEIGLQAGAFFHAKKEEQGPAGTLLFFLTRRRKE